jgi:FKBP-type peptidyl-prolyl cis-trans isomerase FkpA/FKBP-type peptidyl-prolyl cis-trans isomerase FklB
MKGFTEDYQKKQSKYTDDEFRAIMDRFRQSQMVKQRDRMTRLAEENIGKGQAFLDANKTKKGVQVTASGLQYRVIKKGNGPKPDQNSTVEVQYVGKLIDGTEFDSSIKRGAPATFPVTGVIPGWTEALLLMNVGSKFELVIPSNLAYGERGGGPIPPNSVLIFEVELLSVKAGNTPPPAPGQ